MRWTAPSLGRGPEWNMAIGAGILGFQLNSLILSDYLVRRCQGAAAAKS
jgi:hypothetical protein